MTDNTQHGNPSHKLESDVRSYVRSYPIVIKKAKGAIITDENGNEHLDFLAGAGALNYGHNNPHIKKHLIEYLESDGIIHSLDMATQAKNHFMDVFGDLILKPRGLEYKIQFPGPTGTNAVEAALKLARKATGRTGVISFTNGYHGMTLGALAVTGNKYHRENIPGIPYGDVTFMPYCRYTNTLDNSIEFLRIKLEDDSSGLDLPAAIILETIQGEGGINQATTQWLQDLRALCDEFGVLMIIDDIQAGCGRTGDFFSFEESGIVPDIVTLSKSIGAYGLPMALVLMKPEIDVWKPAEHNGTFRGHNLAFVAAAKALEHYWANDDFSKSIKYKSALLKEKLTAFADNFPQAEFSVRGRGLMYGLESLADRTLAGQIQKKCFENSLIIETCGSNGQVLKFLMPLTITEIELNKGLSIIRNACEEILENKTEQKRARKT
ncbi:MAG: diaminobutyrate--2-oxoglutarate transaminase [Alphaproteobacteria bacterium]|nr:diaminobutyrate--2-oxoglutarate transaminase [Alphaproteobacteria bacterium]